MMPIVKIKNGSISMMENKKVNILGTEYEFIITGDTTISDIGDNAGVCNPFLKQIVVKDDLMPHGKYRKEEAKKYFEKEVIRHELIHAFFFESGLDDLARNEQLVDWIAVQFPKMLKAFQELEAL